ncbi:hypothetical protein niasHT_026782 [Heterodera trifolii]|uniref:Uncharacterized protein n=1 Tax=Heterodera trifolii TaxID=157864 RepID=A0ABD2K8Z9_9BILA
MVCSNKNVLIGPLNKFIGRFCTGVVGKDWKNVKTKLIKAFGGQMALIQTLTDNGQNILTKLKKDEENALEEHKASVAQAIRESLKQIAAKMPPEINLETFYEHNKLDKLMQPSDIFGPIVQTLWPKIVELITAEQAKGIGVGGNPKLLASNKRKKRQMDTIILMMALLIGGFFILGLTIYAFTFLIKFFLGPFIVVCSLVAIIWILLLQLV